MYISSSASRLRGAILDAIDNVLHSAQVLRMGDRALQRFGTFRHHQHHLMEDY